MENVIYQNAARYTAYKGTFEDIKSKADAGELIPGRHYIINDYRCTQVIPVVNQERTANFDGWEIVLTATSYYDFSQDAEVVLQDSCIYVSNGGNKIKECKFSIHKEDSRWTTDFTGKFYGVILYLKDEYNNEAPYDFKHIIFRRWIVNSVTANTDVSDGTTMGCFRCWGQSGAVRGDARSWVGSGHSSEKTFIPQIFDGTFPSVTRRYSETDGSKFTPHADYLSVHKFYETYPYISVWNSTSAASSAMSNGYAPMAKINVGTDYKDCYTFSIYDPVSKTYREGSSALQDVSSLGRVAAYFSNCTVKVPKNYGSPQLHWPLSNTVLVVTELDRLEQSYNGCFNVTVVGTDNTFVLVPFKGLSTIVPRLINATLGDEGSSGASNNIIGFTSLIWSKIGLMTSNYGSVYLDNCSITNMNYNVLFGGFRYIRGYTSSNNLLFGTFPFVKKSGASSWVNADDGRYWYDVEIGDWFEYNILNAFQYTKFYPHVNTNTVVHCYNKGNVIYGNFQTNHIQRLGWANYIEYAAMNGIEIGDMNDCHIGQQFWKAWDGDHGTAWYKIREDSKQPNMARVTTKVCGVSPNTLANYAANHTDDSWQRANFGNDHIHEWLALGNPDSTNFRIVTWSSLS